MWSMEKGQKDKWKKKKHDLKIGGDDYDDDAN